MPRGCAQYKLHEVTKRAGLIFFKPGGTDAQAAAQQFFQFPRLMYSGRFRTFGSLYGRIAGRCIRCIFHTVQSSPKRAPLPLPVRLLAENAQNIQRRRRGSGQLRRRRCCKRHLQKAANRCQRRTGGSVIFIVCRGRPAQPQERPCCGQCLIEADAFAQDFVFKAVRQFRSLGNHGIPVRMGQQSLIAGRLGECPFFNADHEHRIRFGQAHSPRRGQDHTVQALGDMPHIGGAQQERKQFGVIGSRQRFLPQQLGQLVEQPHDYVPFPQNFVRFRQTPLGPQRFSQCIQGVFRAQILQEKIQLLCERGCVGIFGALQKLLCPFRHIGAGRLGVLPGADVLFPFRSCVTGGTAGKRSTPVGRFQRPGVGIVFQSCLLAFRQVYQPGFEQTKYRAAGQTTACQFQCRMYRTGRRRIFRRGGLITEQWDVLQPKLIADRAQILFGIPANHRHTVVGRTGAGTSRNFGRHRFGLRLTAGRSMAHNGGILRRNGALRCIGGVRQQQIQLRQCRRIGMAQILGQCIDMYRHTGIRCHAPQAGRHRFCTAEQSHTAVTVLYTVAAQADGDIGYRQHSCQQSALGRIKSIEFINVDGTPRKKIRVQILRSQLLAVARVHGALPQHGFVRAVNQGKFLQLVPVGTGRRGIPGQRLRGDTGTFQFLYRLGCLLTKSSRTALTAVIHHLVQQRIYRPAHQQRSPCFVQRLDRCAAITLQQCFCQRCKGIAFHISGERIPQCTVELPFRGGGKLFRYDQQAVLAALRTVMQFRHHTAGLAASGWPQK